MAVPDMAEVRIAVYDDGEKKYKSQFLWEGMKRLGIHDQYGGYFEIELFYEQMSFHMEFASDDDRFIYKISPSNGSDLLKFHVACMFRWDRDGAIAKKRR